jgi:hypothetical protein
MKTRTVSGKMLAFVLTAVMVIAAGCATSKVGETGFLKDYSKLQPGREGGVDQIYLMQGVDFKRYTKIMMEPVTFYLKEDAKNKGINAGDMKDLSDAFHKAVAKELEGAYPLVSQPGPDVMRIRVAITGLDQSRPLQSGLSTVTPAGLVVSAVGKAATGEWMGVGGASMETEILDSQTNTVIGSAVDRRPGSKIDGFTTWGGAKAAFEFWAKRLRIWLDETHGK